MKVCTGCERNKPLAEFHRSTRNRDGRQSRCKTCQVSAVRGIRQRPEYTAHERQWRAEYVDRVKADPVQHARHRFTKAVADARRRAAAKGAEHVPYTLADLEAQHGPAHAWTCTYCGSDRNISLDHAVPLPDGPDAAHNVVPACGGRASGCNTLKRDRDPREWLFSPERQALLRRQYQAMVEGGA